MNRLLAEASLKQKDHLDTAHETIVELKEKIDKHMEFIIWQKDAIIGLQNARDAYRDKWSDTMEQLKDVSEKYLSDHASGKLGRMAPFIYGLIIGATALAIYLAVIKELI